MSLGRAPRDIRYYPASSWRWNALNSLVSHMQLWSPWVSQYGTHFPSRHWPLSRQPVPFFIGGDLGHSLEAPVHRDSCSQVAYWASRHLTPSRMNAQFWQHGEFLSLRETRKCIIFDLCERKFEKLSGFKQKYMYLHTAPWFLRSLQFLSQHASLSSVPRSPASHSSSPSTRKFPQNDSSGSEKHRPDLACNTFLIDRRLHGENRWMF